MNGTDDTVKLYPFAASFESGRNEQILAPSQDMAREQATTLFPGEELDLLVNPTELATLLAKEFASIKGGTYGPWDIIESMPSPLRGAVAAAFPEAFRLAKIDYYNSIGFPIPEAFARPRTQKE